VVQEAAGVDELAPLAKSGLHYGNVGFFPADFDALVTTFTTSGLHYDASTGG
jgi:hypothetical protein